MGAEGLKKENFHTGGSVSNSAVILSKWGKLTKKGGKRSLGKGKAFEGEEKKKKAAYTGKRCDPQIFKEKKGSAKEKNVHPLKWGVDEGGTKGGPGPKGKLLLS